MSDINDLIARNGHISYEAGRLAERRRIVKILETLPAEFSHNGHSVRTVRTAIKRIEENDANAQYNNTL